MLNKTQEELQLEKETLKFVSLMFTTFFEKFTQEMKKEFDYQIDDCSNIEELNSIKNHQFYQIDDILKVNNFFEIVENTYNSCKRIYLNDKSFYEFTIKLT